jgi:hypothetical protein
MRFIGMIIMFLIGMIFIPTPPKGLYDDIEI